MKRIILTALALATLTGCGGEAVPAPTETPPPGPTITATPAPSPALAASPWDRPDCAWVQISIAGIEQNAPLNALDPALLDTLDGGGEMPAEAHTPPWTRRLYHSPGLELETAVLEPWVLDEMLAAAEDGSSFNQEQYNAALGTEYIYCVRLLDDTHTTQAGLKIGDTVERCRELWYDVEEGDNQYNVMTFSLTITVEGGVVTGLTAQNGGRIVGPYFW